MDSFYKFVLFFVLIFFIIVLGFFIMLYLLNPPTPGLYPPNMSSCPDYWKLDISGNCIIPGNVNLGNNPSNLKNTIGYNSNKNTIDFKTPYWANPCDKKHWANMNNVQWEGISNYNGC